MSRKSQRFFALQHLITQPQNQLTISIVRKLTALIPINGNFCTEAATLCAACGLRLLQNLQAPPLATSQRAQTLWLVVFVNASLCEKIDTPNCMSSPNATTCPRCGSRAHKIRLAWWKRLLLGLTSQYLCSACKHRFRQP